MISPIFLTGTFYVLTLMRHIILTRWVWQMFKSSLERLMYLFTVEVCIAICLSYPTAPGSWTVVIYMGINLLYVVSKPSMFYMLCPGATTTRSIIILYACVNIDNKQNIFAHVYLSAKPYVLYQISLRSKKQSFLFWNSSIMHLLCVNKVSESCFLSSDKRNETLHVITNDLMLTMESTVANQ